MACHPNTPNSQHHQVPDVTSRLQMRAGITSRPVQTRLAQQEPVSSLIFTRFSHCTSSRKGT